MLIHSLAFLIRLPYVPLKFRQFLRVCQQSCRIAAHLGSSTRSRRARGDHCSSVFTSDVEEAGNQSHQSNMSVPPRMRPSHNGPDPSTCWSRSPLCGATEAEAEIIDAIL